MGKMELEEMRRKDDKKVNDTYTQFEDEDPTDLVEPDLESPAEPRIEDTQ